MSKTYDLIQDSPNELTHRYGGSFIAKYGDKGDIIPFFVRSFGKPKDPAKLSITGIQYFTDVGMKFISDELSPREIIWKMPELGYRNLNGKYGALGVYLHMVPERVPTRGLIPNSISATVLYYRKAIGLHKVNKTLAEMLVDTDIPQMTINDVYNPKFFLVKDTLESTKKKIYPLCNNTAIYNDNSSGKVNRLILHRGGIVGTFDPNRGAQLLPRFSYFKEEIAKCL